LRDRLLPNEIDTRWRSVPFPRTVYQWHSDGFDLPQGAHLPELGEANFPDQACR
jgi:hypothetical protein